MATEPVEVLITGEAEKLPISFRFLVESDKPIPPGVQFFEERETNADIAKTVLIGAGLIFAGILLCLLAVVLIFLPLMGLVFIFAGGFMINSVSAKRRAMRYQKAGKQVRNGVFILPEHLMIRTSMDYTIIPHERCGTLTEDHKLVYFLGAAAKSLALPSELVGADVSTMVAALQAWMRPSSQPAGESVSQ